MFGLAFFWNIHSVWYLVLVQILGGICQTTGWPGREYTWAGLLVENPQCLVTGPGPDPRRHVPNHWLAS